MKKPICVIATFVAMSLSTSAFAWDNTPSDRTCIALAQFAGGAADIKKLEADPEKLIRDLKLDNSSSGRAMKLVVQFVYVMNYSREEASQIVYLKCKTGEYHQ